MRRNHWSAQRKYESQFAGLQLSLRKIHLSLLLALVQLHVEAVVLEQLRTFCAKRIAHSTSPNPQDEIAAVRPRPKSDLTV